MNIAQKRLAYSIDEVSEATGICPSMVRRRVKSGALPARKEGAKILILHDDLHDYLLSLPTAAPPQEETV